MSLEEQFNKSIEDWKEHCERTINSSNPGDYLNCDAYRNIVNMGPAILPLIRKEFDKNSLLNGLLVNPVKRIVGKDFQIPEWMAGKMSLIEKYTAKWLDENMQEYLKQN